MNIKKGCFKKTKHVKFFKKGTFLTHLYTHVRVHGVSSVRFWENLTCFVFLKHPFCDSPFYLITGNLCNYFDGKIITEKSLQLGTGFRSFQIALLRQITKNCYYAQCFFFEVSIMM